LKYLLDTHVWIWWNLSPAALSPKIKRLITDGGHYEEMLLSAVSTWEFCKLVEKGRLNVASDPLAWMEQALDMPKLRLVPLTPRIAHQSTVLPGLSHDDPADQIILATAREENAVLLTKDGRLRAYPHVKTLW
jgi:PIN domain nuclease of toxin-antitoxin system